MRFDHVERSFRGPSFSADIVFFGPLSGNNFSLPFSCSFQPDSNATDVNFVNVVGDKEDPADMAVNQDIERLLEEERIDEVRKRLLLFGRLFLFSNSDVAKSPVAKLQWTSSLSRLAMQTRSLS